MPRNFKEALLFTILMCGMMVCGMSLWNLLILDWTGVVPEITKIFAHRLSWAFTLCKIANAIVLASGPTKSISSKKATTNPGRF